MLKYLADCGPCQERTAKFLAPSAYREWVNVGNAAATEMSAGVSPGPLPGRKPPEFVVDERQELLHGVRAVLLGGRII